MSISLLALVPAFFFAVTNHLDKYLLSRFFQGGGRGSLLIISSLAGVPVAVAIFFFDPTVVAVAPAAMGILLLAGFLYMLGLLPYLTALDQEEASLVVPLFQLTPVAALILGYLFLGETVAGSQLIGALIIMCGAVLLSLELGEDMPTRFRWHIFGLLGMSSCLLAVGALLFKYAAQDMVFWHAMFWQYTGGVVFGFCSFIVVASFRNQFLEVIQKNSIGVLSLNGLNEAAALIAQTVLSYTTLLAPVAVVYWISEGFQPFFVFLIGILLTIFFPSIAREKITARHLAQKFLAIAIMVIGLYLLST